MYTVFLFLTIFNEGAYLTFKSIFHKFLAQGNNGGLWWGSNPLRVRRATHCATPYTGTSNGKERI